LNYYYTYHFNIGINLSGIIKRDILNMLLIEKFSKTLYFIFQTCEYKRTSVDSDLVCIDDDDDDEANFETTENLQTHPDQFHYDEDLQTYDHFQNPKNEVSSDETESSDSSSDSAIEARTTKKKVFLKKSEKNSSNHKTSSSESEDENANSVSSLSKKECVNVKSSKQNKTFSKKLEQNSSDSKVDNDFISESSKPQSKSSEQLSFKEKKKMSKESESNSESSSSEDKQEPIAKPIKTKEKSFKEFILPNKRKASNKSSSESETSSSEDESSDEPSRFIKKYFKLFSSKPSEKHKKNLSSESSSSEGEQESISEPSKSSKKSVKPSTKEPKNTSSKAREHDQSSSSIETSTSEDESITEPSKSTKPSTKEPKNTSSKTREHYQSSSSIETSSSEDESITEPSKSSKEYAKPSTKEPKKTSSKIPENYQRTSSIDTSSFEDDEEQTISELSDSNKKSTKNRSCRKSSENSKKAKTTEEISSTTSNETSSKTSKEISLKTSNETSSSSDDEEKLIHELSNSAKTPMTSSYVKQPRFKSPKEAKKDSSKTSKQISSKPSKEPKKDSSKTPKQTSSKTSEQISSKTSKQISSNIDSSSSESEQDSIPPPVKPKKKPAEKPTSKTTNEKSTFESTKNGSEKSYKDYSPILEGYGDLLDRLNPEDPKSEVDKVVKFILEKNIKVRHVNIALCRFTNVRAPEFGDLHKKMRFIKVGRYSAGDFGDDDRLKKRWNELVEIVPIIDPNQCIVDFSQLKNGEGVLLKKRNVLGCFLGQDLTHVRHCADVFQHACSLLTVFKSGKFSREEDLIILEEAKKSGACCSTWKNVTLKLNRNRVDATSRRYTALTKEQSLFRGHWTLTEEEILLESLFSGKKNAGIDEIKSVALKDFPFCSEKLNRSKKNVYMHWRNSVLPILLSYNYETLHQPWRRDFFEYLIKKKVAGVQDIDYSEASSFWPEQSSTSFVNSIKTFSQKQANQSKPLYQIIQENLHSFKDLQETERVRNYREEIVQIYDEVKNRTI